MNYSIAGVEICVLGTQIEDNAIFSPFVAPERQANYRIDIRCVDCIAVPDNCKPYGSYRIKYTDGLESKYYLDCLDHPYAAVRECSKASKKLLIVNEAKEFIRQESALFNHLAMERTLYHFGRLLLHASFIKTPQGAILFSAPSGTGKSTQAALWERYMGSEIINGDRAAVWREESGWMAGGVPWCGSSEITKNEIMPLRTIVMLRQAPENQLRTPSLMEKLKLLLHETTVNPWDEQMIVGVQRLLVDLCSAVPVVQLSCRPDEEAVRLLAKALEVEHA